MLQTFYHVGLYLVWYASKVILKKNIPKYSFRRSAVFPRNLELLYKLGKDFLDVQYFLQKYCASQNLLRIKLRYLILCIPRYTSWYRWYLRTYYARVKENRKKKIKKSTALDLNKCLKQIKFVYTLQTCAPCFELPSDVRTMI